MRVKLKLYLPMLAEAVGRSELELAFDGKTVGDLLQHLVRRFGRRAAQALFDGQGELDREIQVLLNSRTWVTRENLHAPLGENDQVTIMVLMAGG